MVLLLLALPLVDHDGSRSCDRFLLDHSQRKNILYNPGDKGPESHRIHSPWWVSLFFHWLMEVRPISSNIEVFGLEIELELGLKICWFDQVFFCLSNCGNLMIKKFTDWQGGNQMIII